MESKEQLKNIINIVSDRSGLSQEKLAERLGYGKTYISEMLSPRGKVTSKFIRVFRNQFAEYLENPKKQESILKEEKIIQVLDDRIKELKEDKEWLKKMLESNLTGLIAGQASVLAHIQAGLEQVDEINSDGSKRKVSQLRESRGKRISELLGGSSERGKTPYNSGKHDRA